jgi:two-component system, NarL family, nitrate/nitrite response regulator NarL
MMHMNDFTLTVRVCPRVLVVSDTLLYREGVARGLAHDEKLIVAGVATGREALATMAEVAADAVLLDTAAPDALAVARKLKLAWPDVAVIGFGVGDDANSLACAEAGLVGFVGRDGTLAELATAVERALAGEVRCSPKLAALLCERVAALAGRIGDVPTGLTRRERQIADLVADGLSNKEIAIELRIGPATVKNHIHNILEKLHVPRRGAIGSRLRGFAAA